VTSARDHATVDDACVIITGAPAAGKTTVSQLVAEALPRSARLGGDDVRELVVNGYVWGLGDPPDEAARQTRLMRQNLCALAANFADAGFTPVIDALISDRATLDEFLDLLAPRQVLLVVLAPTVDVHRQRNEDRDPEEQFFFDDYETLTTTMRLEVGPAGWWLDTSGLTASDTAALIVEQAALRARVRR
jgi:adenylylsulfate kinase-like enzyme